MKLINLNKCLLFSGKGGIIRVLWYYGYNNKIGKLPIDNVANSDFPKFCENDIFWETRADPLTGVIYRENISQVSSVRPSVLKYF